LSDLSFFLCVFKIVKRVRKELSDLIPTN